MRSLTGLAGLMALVYASVAAAAAPESQPKPDLERGKQIAGTVCVACHGADGNSTQPTNPILASQHADYIVAQLTAFKSGARPSPIMQGMAAPLSAEDIRNVAAWFESQKQAPSIARDKALALRGQQLWRAGIKNLGVPACAGCHGAAGHGIPAQYPRLAGQYADLVFGWLRAYANGARPHPVMSVIASRLSENDMKALAEYAAGLR
jgi:cytochrome c553